MLLLGRQLYRSLLKEAVALPHPRLSDYYLAHVRESFRRPAVPETSSTAIARVKLAQKLLRHLQATNDGYVHALQRAYETAFGLRGKNRHRALAPFLSSAIPTLARENFPPPLAALVTSSLSHHSRPPSRSQLSSPPTLPQRADHTSEEARLLGPLPLQRDRAIRRRWWNSQTSKVRAPIASRLRTSDGVLVDDIAVVTKVLKENGLVITSERARQGAEAVEQLKASCAVFSSALPLPPRRLQTPEQRSACRPSPPTSRRSRGGILRQVEPFNRAIKWRPPKALSPRFLRRVAQSVAEKAVVVTLSLPPTMEDASDEAQKSKGVRSAMWEVSLTDAARSSRGRYREMDGEERWWHERDEMLGLKRKKGKGSAKKSVAT